MKIASRSMRRLALPVASILLTAALTWYSSATRAADPASQARRVISDDPNTTRTAIASLRAAGPAGLQTLLTTYDRDIAQHVANPTMASDTRWQRITAALDAVGQQKDCYASRLYWYTDLGQAEKAAQATGKPILSLRLLGNLNEELSCANSRFFRTTLYPNAQIAAYLRSHYILHWQSVRPVPVFTLDFGDGRKIVRTITGNSIHYVLDSKGRPVDALPGLYGPEAFLRHLTEDAAVAHQSEALTDDTARHTYLSNWHEKQIAKLSQAWSTDTKQAFGQRSNIPTLVSLIEPIGNPRPTEQGNPSALTAGMVAMSKGVGETPIVSAISPEGTWAIGASILNWGWDNIGKIHASDAVLDVSSRSLMASKHPDVSFIQNEPIERRRGFGGGFLLANQSSSPTPANASLSGMDRLVVNFQRVLAQDSIRNEYVYHTKLHGWFADGEVSDNLAELNKRVYSDLFLTPSTDRWLGLAPSGIYTGLPQDGRIDTPSTDTSKTNIATR